MKIVNRGLLITEIEVDGVHSIETSDAGIVVEMGNGTPYTWSAQEVHILIEALQAAIGEHPLDQGSWSTPEDIPEHLTKVYDRDDDEITRELGQTWPQTLETVVRYGPWRLRK